MTLSGLQRRILAADLWQVTPKEYAPGGEAQCLRLGRYWPETRGAATRPELGRGLPAAPWAPPATPATKAKEVIAPRVQPVAAATDASVWGPRAGVPETSGGRKDLCRWDEGRTVRGGGCRESAPRNCSPRWPKTGAKGGPG